MEYVDPILLWVKMFNTYNNNKMHKIGYLTGNEEAFGMYCSGVTNEHAWEHVLFVALSAFLVNGTFSIRGAKSPVECYV